MEFKLPKSTPHMEQDDFEFITEEAPLQGPQQESSSEHGTGSFFTMPEANYDTKEPSDGFFTSFTEEAEQWSNRLQGWSPEQAEKIQSGEYWQDAGGGIYDKDNKLVTPEGTRLDAVSNVVDYLEPGSIKFTSGMSSLKKTKDATKEWKDNKRFKQGITHHVDDKDRELFKLNERNYLDNVSGTIKPMSFDEGNPQPIFRGMKLKPDDDIMQMEAGDYLTSDQVQSFTWDKGIAERFAKPFEGSAKSQSVMMVMSDRQSGIDLPKLTGHNAWSESEVAMPAGAKFEILDIEEMPDGQRILYIGESQTVPKGSRIMNASEESIDYTNLAEVEKVLTEKQNKIKKWRAKGNKTLTEKHVDSFERIKAEFERSQANKPEGFMNRNKAVEETEDVDYAAFVKSQI